MRLIDADAVANAVRDEIVEAHSIEAAPDFIAGLRLALAYVNTAETLDAVVVVRCGDCEYYRGEHAYCANDFWAPRRFCYCYFGRRREDDETD